VAILFIGIFMTMMPALDWLSHHAGEIGIKSLTSFYWSCGILSAVLDNAPTYLNFLAVAIGLQPIETTIAPSEANKVLNLAITSNSPLAAISVAAVFFGACTYIGNGPNFMVKSIAQHAGTRMPSFFGYILKYTIPILLPILVLIWFLFFRQ
jgi:Na+/H+ antiporter NhaD/arsenite permease-like protein